MRVELHLSLSASQRGELYHYTDKARALRMLRSGKLRLAIGQAMASEYAFMRGRIYSASFTRSRFGAFHMNLEYSSYDSVMLTFDGDKLSENYKIIPIDFFGDNGAQKRSKGKSEAEERLVSNKPEIDVIRYLKRVDFIRTPEAEETLTGSFLLQLKKHKIPYAYYPTIKDWAYGKNSYDLDVKKNHGDFDQKLRTSDKGHAKQLYRSMRSMLEALVVDDYNDMSERAQNKCRGAHFDPDGILRDYNYMFMPEESTYPDGTIYAPARSIAQKVARVLHKNNLNNSDEVIAFLLNKAKKAKAIT